jgi:hypothetical protein
LGSQIEDGWLVGHRHTTHHLKKMLRKHKKKKEYCWKLIDMAHSPYLVALEFAMFGGLGYFILDF